MNERVIEGMDERVIERCRREWGTRRHEQPKWVVPSSPAEPKVLVTNTDQAARRAGHNERGALHQTRLVFSGFFTNNICITF